RCAAPTVVRLLIRECLRKDPAERFPSAKELAARLKPLLSGKASKRPQRALWVAGAAVALVLLLSAVAWWYFRSGHERNMALDSLAVLPLDNFSRDPEQ